MNLSLITFIKKMTSMELRRMFSRIWFVQIQETHSENGKMGHFKKFEHKKSGHFKEKTRD